MSKNLKMTQEVKGLEEGRYSPWRRPEALLVRCFYREMSHLYL
jgi:hypothetical protein